MHKMNAHVDLIKKLLRLARCKAASHAEASLALNRAMELIRKHDVDVATLDLDDAGERMVLERIEIGWRVSLAKHHALRVLLNHFNVDVVLSKPDAAILGTQSDVAIAIYVFEFILGACTRATSAWAKREKAARRKTTGAKRLSFQQGWFYGLRDGLKRPDETTGTLDDSRTSLVIAERRRRLEAFVDEQFPKRTEVKRKPPRENKTAIWKGFLAGRETRINKPLDAPADGPLLLE